MCLDVLSIHYKHNIAVEIENYLSSLIQKNDMFEYMRVLRSVVRNKHTYNDRQTSVEFVRAIQNKTVTFTNREQELLETSSETQSCLFSSLITCKACKKKKVTYYQKQVRGSDEPMTIFYECQECGKKWKE